MTPFNIQNANQQQIDAIIDSLSSDRFTTYLDAAGRNPERALQLYAWNARVGEAFYIPCQAVEIGLRNRINHALIAQFGADWWNNERFLKMADKPRNNDLVLVQKRIENRRLPLVTGQIVAGLSFGFWAGMLQARYNPDVWSRQLRKSFPQLPAHIDRKTLSDSILHLLELRNRISHHEPLIRRDLLQDHSRAMQVLNWLCPTKAAWLKPYCRAPIIVREKP
ncbi:MAG: hypothetical protein RL186_181 [Pseudomonadota bacterium]